MKTIAEIEHAIAPLDAAVRPIAQSGIDLTSPGWLVRWRAHVAQHKPEPWQPALDRAGVRAEADALIAEIIDRYASGTHAEREAIRALFRRYDSFCWAASVPHAPVTEDTFRRTLILFSIKDQEKDWRDAIVWLDGLCAAAGPAGLPQAQLLTLAAALSSDAPAFEGRRSTRKVLLDYAARASGSRRR